MPSLVDNWKVRAHLLKTEVYALYLAYKDPRTPWYARLFAAVVVAYAFSPIDLIPDPIPILGYLDDLIITPGGLWLAVRLIPAEVLAQAREKATSQGMGRSEGYVGAVIIVLVWIVILIGIIYLIKFLS